MRCERFLAFGTTVTLTCGFGFACLLWGAAATTFSTMLTIVGAAVLTTLLRPPDLAFVNGRPSPQAMRVAIKAGIGAISVLALLDASPPIACGFLVFGVLSSLVWWCSRTGAVHHDQPSELRRDVATASEDLCTPLADPLSDIEVGRLSDAELCHEWRRSFARLQTAQGVSELSTVA